MEIQHIQISDTFTFPLVKNKRIAVNMSDGADSALLTYILLSNYQGPLQVITSTTSNGNSALLRATNLLHFLVSLTGNQNVIHTLDYTGDIGKMFNVTSTLLHNKVIDVVYTGTNATPPPGSKTYEKFKNTPEMVKRDPFVQRPQVYNDQVIVPFTNLDKKEIYNLYCELGVLETIYPKTFSCINADSKTQCGVCAECEERIYGFGRLE